MPNRDEQDPNRNRQGPRVASNLARTSRASKVANRTARIPSAMTGTWTGIATAKAVPVDSSLVKTSRAAREMTSSARNRTMLAPVRRTVQARAIPTANSTANGGGGPTASARVEGSEIG